MTLLTNVCNELNLTWLDLVYIVKDSSLNDVLLLYLIAVVFPNG